jgi:hypothetical protein
VHHESILADQIAHLRRLASWLLRYTPRIPHSHCLRTPTHTGVQVREEAGELCQTLEADEGKERAASEMADLLYHAMVLLNVQVRR